MSKRIAVFMLPLVAALLLALFSVAALADTSTAKLHAPWTALLQKHVRLSADQQRSAVDYAGFRQDREQLKAYLSNLAELSQETFDQWGEARQLAFLINAYNAWTVELVLRQSPGLESIRDIGGWFRSPWSLEFIPLLGASRSLDDIEHRLIRGSGRYREPRIHFAVNCASVGCPALADTAYTADALERQLDLASRRFLQDRSRNRLRDGRLQISPIFKWYREDFEQAAGSLSAFLLRYAEDLGLDAGQRTALANGGIKIEFTEYDWALNRS